MQCLTPLNKCLLLVCMCVYIGECVCVCVCTCMSICILFARMGVPPSITVCVCVHAHTPDNSPMKCIQNDHHPSSASTRLSPSLTYAACNSMFNCSFGLKMSTSYVYASEVQLNCLLIK